METTVDQRRAYLRGLGWSDEQIDFYLDGNAPSAGATGGGWGSIGASAIPGIPDGWTPPYWELVGEPTLYERGEFDEKISKARREKESAIDAGDFDTAASLRDREKVLVAQRAEDGERSMLNYFTKCPHLDPNFILRVLNRRRVAGGLTVPTFR